MTMTIQSNLDSPRMHHQHHQQQSHRAAMEHGQQQQQHRFHQHDPAYNITSAEGDEYNSDNSIAVLQHHHRYMPSNSSSSCDNTKHHPGPGSSSAGHGSCDENTPSVLDINLDTKKIALTNAANNSRLNSPARFENERKYTNHIEVYSDNSTNKLEEEISEDDRGPPLPPRPAPRTRTLQRAESGEFLMIFYGTGHPKVWKYDLIQIFATCIFK